MSDPLDSLGRARLVGATLLVLTFVVGVLAGAAGERLLERRAGPPPRAERENGAPRLPRVLEEMSLTAAQRAAIDSILASGRPRNEAIIAEVLPRFRAVGDSLHTAIRTVLTPAQAARFDAYLRSAEGTPELPPIESPARPAPPRVDDREDRRPPPDGGDRRRPPRDDRDGRRPPPRDDRDGRQPPPRDDRDGRQPPPHDDRDGRQPPA